MKTLFYLLFILGFCSCRITTGTYTPSYDYSYDTRPVVNVIAPPFIPNPYLYRLTPIWYNPYRWTYLNTPR